MELELELELEPFGILASSVDDLKQEKTEVAGRTYKFLEK
jgi:hypothetical protein